MVDSTRGSRVQVVRAEHAPRGRGRLHRRGLARRCSPSSTSTASSSATPSAASSSARPTRRWRARCPAALEAGLEPILCVGETEAEREAGETERSAAPPGRRPASPRSRRAPRRGRDRLRADLGDRHRQGRDARAGPGGVRASSARCVAGDRRRRGRRRCAILYGGSVKPDNAAELLGAARHRRRAGRRRRARPGDFADDRRGGDAACDAERCPLPASVAGHPRRLGPRRRPGPGNAVSLADTPVFDELWARYPHTQLTRLAAATSACPTGQMGNSEVGHLNLGAGAIVQPGPDAHRRRDRRRAASTRTRPCSPRARVHATPARRLHLHRPRLRRRRALEHGAPRGADRGSPPTRACRTSSSTPSPTAATRRRTGGAGYLAQARATGCAQAGTPHRHASSAATSRWTATSAGTACKLAYDAIVHGAPGTARRTRRRGDRDAYDARRDRRVHQADDRRRRRRRSADGDVRHRLQLPPRPHARDRRARSPTRTSTTFDRGGGAARRR